MPPKPPPPTHALLSFDDLNHRFPPPSPADNGGSAAAGVASLASHLLLVTQSAASQVADNFVGVVVSVGANQSLLRPTTIVEEDENVNEVACIAAAKTGIHTRQNGYQRCRC